MIDWEKTELETGYGKEYFDRFPKSSKKVYKICKKCKKIDKIRFQSDRNLCRSCANKQNRKLPKPEFVLEKDRYLNNTQIDRILTIKQFGYDPIDLGKGSSRKVIRRCKKCKEIKEIRFFSYRDLCLSCSNNQEEVKITKSCRLQGITRKDFNGFVTKQPYCILWTEEFRASIRERYHYKCYLCGKEQGNRKLSVHHVNYNKNCLCGSNCEFVPLCCSCHAKTGSNRQYWENLIMNYLYPNRYFMGDI